MNLAELLKDSAYKVKSERTKLLKAAQRAVEIAIAQGEAAGMAHLAGVEAT